MMRYAQVQGTTLVKYPYLFSDLQADNPNTNYGDNYDVAHWFPLTEAAAETGYTLEPVTELAEPTFDPNIKQAVLNAEPTLVGGVWTLGWDVSDLTSGQIVERTQQWRNRASCTPFQGRMALADAGLLSAVETAIAAADEKTKVAWEYALEWKRSSPMIAALSTALNMTDTQIDDLFKAAAQISA